MPECVKLFVFEGPDGSGKTTLSRAFAKFLNSAGIDCKYFAFPGREVGSLGKVVHDLHHNFQSAGIESLTPTSLQILHIAAHIDAIEARILPALQKGQSVVLDRFWWSTMVYGTVTDANKELLKKMVELEQVCWGTSIPTVVFLIMRSNPIGSEATDEWKAIVEEYSKLAAQEMENYPVCHIENDGDFAKALSQVQECIRLSEELRELNDTTATDEAYRPTPTRA
jgi:thymidylate kinase